VPTDDLAGAERLVRRVDVTAQLALVEEVRLTLRQPALDPPADDPGHGLAPFL
jgi:hypothetical protein